VVDPPDKTAIKQLFDLFIDEVLSLSLLFSGLLLDWPDVRVNLQMVLNHLHRDPRHL
jgi:hypothetical protein